LSLLQSLASVPAGSPAYVETLSQVGELMIQTHRAYGTIGLGCPETDVMITRLMALGPTRGIYGARMSGGGSGGTVAVLCERAAVPLVDALGREVTFGEPFPGLIE
jgi:galactokinase